MTHNERVAKVWQELWPIALNAIAESRDGRAKSCLSTLIREAEKRTEKRIRASECMPTDADERRYLDAFQEAVLNCDSAEALDAERVFIIRSIIRNAEKRGAERAKREQPTIAQVMEDAEKRGAMVPCPMCEGDEFIVDSVDDAMDPCPTCHGEGEIPAGLEGALWAIDRIFRDPTAAADTADEEAHERYGNPSGSHAQGAQAPDGQAPGGPLGNREET